MAYYTKTTQLRTTEDLQAKMNELMKAFPDKYDNHSTVMRAAVIVLYRTEMKQK